MKAPVIEINHRTYQVKSIAMATELAKLLSGLVEVERRHSSDYSKTWYEEADDGNSNGLDVKLHVAVEVRKRPERMALPAPRRGSIRCNCGRGTVLPGEHCPSCNLSFTAILESRP